MHDRDPTASEVVGEALGLKDSTENLGHRGEVYGKGLGTCKKRGSFSKSATIPVQALYLQNVENPQHHLGRLPEP